MNIQTNANNTTVKSTTGLPLATYLSNHERGFFVDLREFSDFVHLQFKPTIAYNTRLNFAKKLQKYGFAVTLYQNGELRVFNQTRRD